MKILYSIYNTSGYLEAEVRELVKNPEVEFVLWRYPHKIEKTMMETLGNRCRWIDRTQVTSLKDLLSTLNDWRPDLYICGGWNDKAFVAAAKYYRQHGCRNVLGMDTPWEGRIKQYLNCIRFRFTLLSVFDFVFCAGLPQKKYALNLGFASERITQGVYCADTEKFAPLYNPRRKVSHTFLYVGRYVDVKNMHRMEQAFLNALQKMPASDWTLLCIGTGELWQRRTVHSRIKHLGYKAPNEIQNYVGNAGCFILPSLREPWGVVVHEFALMGLPLLCSNNVNAAMVFLKDGESGFLFDPLQENEITEAFLKIMQSSDEELSEMGATSHKLAMGYTLTDWANRVYSFLKN